MAAVMLKQSEVPAAAGTAKPPMHLAEKPFLELENLSKSYGSGAHVTQVLKDINLTIREGEFVAIVGFSGSGKTTLISLIAGLIQADAGAVRVKGQAVTEPGRTPSVS